jgi:hypothetical protein
MMFFWKGNEQSWTILGYWMQSSFSMRVRNWEWKKNRILMLFLFLYMFRFVYLQSKHIIDYHVRNVLCIVSHEHLLIIISNKLFLLIHFHFHLHAAICTKITEKNINIIPQSFSIFFHFSMLYSFVHLLRKIQINKWTYRRIEKISKKMCSFLFYNFDFFWQSQN